MKRLTIILLAMLIAAPLWAQMGRRFPSERSVINDPKQKTNLPSNPARFLNPPKTAAM